MKNLEPIKDSILNVPEVDIQLTRFPKVAAIIITKDNTKMLFDAVESLIKQGYPNLEIHIADTGSNFDSKLAIKKWLKKNESIGINWIWGYEYNYSKNNNDVVKDYVNEDTELLYFLNNDIKFINNNINQYLFMFNKDIETNQAICGTIGSQLLFLNQSIQHQGIFLQRDIKGFVGAGHIGMNSFKYQYNCENVVGNTGAMLMIRKDLFEEIGGFDEKLKLFQDVKLNIECLKRGRLNFNIRSAASYHYESVSRRKSDYDIMKDDMILKRDLIRMQKYFNENYEFINKKEYLTGVR